MRGGLLFSVVFHAAILGWALFTIHSQPQLRMPEQEHIDFDLITPSEVTKLRQGSRDAKQLEAQAKETPKPDIAKKEAEKPKPVATAPPPPPPPEPPAPKEPEKKADPIAEKLASVPPPPPPAPEPPAPAAPPPPAPGIEEQKKLDELMREQERQAEEAKKAEELKKLEEQKRQEEARKLAEAKKKEEAKKKKEAELKKKRDEEKKRKEAEAKRFDADKMSALLNKIPDKGAPPPTSEPTEPTKNKGPVKGVREGRDRTLSVSERDALINMLTSRIEQCYRPPVGAAAGLEGLRVQLSFDLKPDGTLVGPPKAVRVDGSALSRTAAEAAERAVVGCQPYQLPPDKYEFWKGVDLEFNPKRLFGG